MQISIYSFPLGNLFKRGNSYFQALGNINDNGESRECLEIKTRVICDFWVKSKVQYSEFCKYNASGKIVKMPIAEVKELITSRLNCERFPADRCAGDCNKFDGGGYCKAGIAPINEKDISKVGRVLNLDNEEINEVRAFIKKGSKALGYIPN